MEEHEFIFYEDKMDIAWYCGMDVHKHKLVIALYSSEREPPIGLKTAIFSADVDGLRQFWNLLRKYRPLGFVMEATGIYHHLPYNFLVDKQKTEEWIFQVILVNLPMPPDFPVGKRMIRWTLKISQNILRRGC